MIALERRIEGGDYSAGGMATRALKDQLRLVGVTTEAMRRAMIASYEAEMNVVIHARRGRLWARVDDRQLELEVTDEGPGIPDVELAMREGWSTASAEARRMGFGAGMGLPNIRRAADRFDLDSRAGVGTRLRATIVLNGDRESLCEDGPASLPALAIRSERCRRCLQCLSACPMGALRVTSGGPARVAHLCIGCTECAARCPDRAFHLAVDRAAGLRELLRGAVLVVPRGLLASPAAGPDPRAALAALAATGIAALRFTEEWEAGLLEECARRSAGPGSPVIAPVCPAVTALVETRFPGLLPLVAPLASPLEAAAASTPLARVVAVATCPAQVEIARRDGAAGRVAVIEVADVAALIAGSGAGPRAGAEPGPVHAAPRPEATGGLLQVSGLPRVQRALELAEMGRLPGVGVLAAWACDGGCAGSPSLGSDAFLAAHRLRAAGIGEPPSAPSVPIARPRLPRRGSRLDPDMGEAIRKLGLIDGIARALPGRDCRSCGAPSCAAFAEDLVTGRAGAGDCPHRTRPLPFGGTP